MEFMATIPRHFEMNGWEEATVAVRLRSIAILPVLLSLSTLKLR